MMSVPASSGMTPPIEPDPLSPEAPLTKWPKVIGIISLIYACFGLMCGVGYALMMLLMESLMAMGGMDVETPPVIKIFGLANAFLGLVFAVVMLIGAVNLLRRKRRGVTLLKAWALMSVVLIVLGIVVGVITAPAQVAFQRSIAEATEEQMRESGQVDAIPPQQTDEEIWSGIVRNTAIISAVFAVYPVFIMLYLSRKKITNETIEWR